MQFTKVHLGNLFKCYSTIPLPGSEGDFLFGSEGDIPWRIYSAKGECASVEGSCGGTMGFAPIPGKNGDFLAIQRFYSTVNSDKAELAWAERRDAGYRLTKLFTLPHLHRFDILPTAHGPYLFGATLASSKKDKADWSDPGGVYAIKMPEKPGPLFPRRILGGLTKNHGYFRLETSDGSRAVVAAEEGVFLFSPPESERGGWRWEQILDRPVSDLAFADLDGDGERELITIEPFHGENLVVYRKENGQYRPIWKRRAALPFGHVLWTGTLRGIPVIIGGGRNGDMDLLCLTAACQNPLRFEEQVIETGCGPANIAVTHGPDRDTIAVANRQVGEAALFHVTL